MPRRMSATLRDNCEDCKLLLIPNMRARGLLRDILIPYFKRTVNFPVTLLYVMVAQSHNAGGTDKLATELNDAASSSHEL